MGAAAGRTLRVTAVAGAQQAARQGNSSPDAGTANTSTWDVMVSYRVVETGKCEKGGDGTAPALAQLLMEHGYRVFVDADNLMGGDDWLRIITRAVASSKALVPIISTTYGNADKSKYTYEEYKLAHSRQKVIVPVYHSGDFPPLDLSLIMGSTMQYVPVAGAMTGPRKSSVQEVAEEVVRALKRAGVHPSVNVPQSERAGVHPTVNLLQTEIFARVCGERQGPDGVEVRRLAASCGGADGLVALLRNPSASDVAKQQAAWGLRNLVFNDDPLKQRIADAGGIPPLVALLQPGSGASAGTKGQAAWALMALAHGDQALKQHVADAGAAAPLVALLQPGSGASDATKQYAAGALCNLAIGDQALKQRVADAGAIAPLVALLQPGSGTSDGTKHQAAGALWALAAGDQALKQRVADAGAIAPLVALLQPGSGASDTTKQHAAGALKSIAWGSSERTTRIKQLLGTTPGDAASRLLSEL